ncbi:hypothetical protein D5366_03900 [Neokomagataea tanensis]|uniref:UrcA family protein n=1 Tax=Neokomagataea tanensis TaxID=661191 RepID=A0A4Y6V7A8_9PROT|nr:MULTISPECIES: hypothetical protein [Neokomagataea]QDH24521.1 hypothetical protein D5366_03900 [Neokomagataea tanensis]
MMMRPAKAALLLAASFLLPFSAHAAGNTAPTNDDDPSINMQGAVVNKILQVLQVRQDLVGDSCYAALKTMHDADAQLSKEESNDRNQDIGVARDVASSAMEDVTTICGADAQTICRTPDPQHPQLAVACHALPHDLSTP